MTIREQTVLVFTVAVLVAMLAFGQFSINRLEQRIMALEAQVIHIPYAPGPAITGTLSWGWGYDAHAAPLRDVVQRLVDVCGLQYRPGTTTAAVWLKGVTDEGK